MTDVNHQISKALVEQYGSNTLFALENLEGVKFAFENLKKEQKYQNHSWAFYQFEQFLTYKATQKGSFVEKFDAHYKSQRCPKCGQIEKSNRDHRLHQYTCDKCDYQSNDDRIGAMNVLELGRMFLAGIKQPSFA